MKQLRDTLTRHHHAAPHRPSSPPRPSQPLLAAEDRVPSPTRTRSEPPPGYPRVGPASGPLPPVPEQTVIVEPLATTHARGLNLNIGHALAQPIDAMRDEVHQIVHGIKRFFVAMSAGGATASATFGLGLWLSGAAIAGRPSVLDPAGLQRPWLGRGLFVAAIFPLPELGFWVGYRGSAMLFDALCPDA